MIRLSIKDEMRKRNADALNAVEKLGKKAPKEQIRIVGQLARSQCNCATKRKAAAIMKRL